MSDEGVRMVGAGEVDRSVVVDAGSALLSWEVAVGAELVWLGDVAVVFALCESVCVFVLCSVHEEDALCEEPVVSLSVMEDVLAGAAVSVDADALDFSLVAVLVSLCDSVESCDSSVFHHAVEDAREFVAAALS